MKRKSLKDYREPLLKETAKMLAEGGPESISMRKLAGRVGISAGGIYKIFRNKEDLLLEAARYASLEFKHRVLAMNDVKDILQATIEHSEKNKGIISYLAMKDPSFTKSFFKDIVEHLGNIVGNKPKARVMFKLAAMQGVIKNPEEKVIILDLIEYLLNK